MLDTNVLLRLVSDSADLSDGFKDAVESALDDGEVAVSAITFMETTRLHHHGRINLGQHPATWRRERLASGLRELPVDGDIAVESVLLMNSGFHRDPADQVIVATAMLHGLTLATTDAAIHDWAERTRLVQLLDPAA
ncbi:type II toxin-antitoxin system VapC family toxin [Candidatus Poriferisodalis sp.]|uniref:type II toxin-antitoxin system VapC family toxin n=1 Tax=Candidatus Poriferisodalis sp. TaxID=3101277 RepID=UPI003B592799